MKVQSGFTAYLYLLVMLFLTTYLSGCIKAGTLTGTFLSSESNNNPETTNINIELIINSITATTTTTTTYDGVNTPFIHYQCVPITLKLKDVAGNIISLTTDSYFQFIQDNDPNISTKLFSNEFCTNEIVPSANNHEYKFPAGFSNITVYNRVSNTTQNQISIALGAKYSNSSLTMNSKSIKINPGNSLNSATVVLDPSVTSNGNTIEMASGEILFPQTLLQDKTVGIAPYSFMNSTSISIDPTLGNFNIPSPGNFYLFNLLPYMSNFFKGNWLITPSTNSIDLQDASGSKKTFSVNYNVPDLYFMLNDTGGNITPNYTPNISAINLNGPQNSSFYDKNGYLFQIPTGASSIPRYDYDPSQCMGTAPNMLCRFRGLLVEGSSSNLLKYTANFSTAGSGWIYINLPSFNLQTSNSSDYSPLGPFNSKPFLMINDNDPTLPNNLMHTSLIGRSGYFTVSVYLKKPPTADASKYVGITILDSPLTGIVVDMDRNEIVSINNLDSTAKEETEFGVQELKSTGWIRVWFVTPNLPNSNLTFRIYPAYADKNAALTLNQASATGYDLAGAGAPDILATGSVYVFGPQVELGTLLTSYIENTTSTPLTRSEDFQTLNLTASPFSLTPAESATLLVDYDIDKEKKFINKRSILHLTDGSTQNIEFRLNNLLSNSPTSPIGINFINSLMSSGGGSIANCASFDNNFGLDLSAAVSFGPYVSGGGTTNSVLSSHFNFGNNSGSPVKQTNCSRIIGGISIIYITLGNNSAGGNSLYGHIRSIKLWKKQLSDSVVQSMTMK